jgi:hypothetical protein
VSSIVDRAAGLAVLLGALGPGVLGGSAQEVERVLRIPRVDQPPPFDRFLASHAVAGSGMEAAPVGVGEGGLGVRVTDWRQREPGDGVPASQATTAYLSYDDANLYVTFVCEDDPTKVRAGLTKREEIAVDDGVAVYLDTFHDRTRAYVFQTNPLGVQLDGIVTEGQDDDYSFDTVWQSEGRLTASGYVVRIAVPFRSLRFANTPTQTWGIALARFIRRTNEEVYWPYVTKRRAGLVPQFATLVGLRDISPGRNLQATPYGAFTSARFLDVDAPAFRAASDRRVGLDLKAVIRDALTLDGTVNPDFSQVESDEPQVTINERFEVFFPEKRPFFIENAGYFQTPVNLMFSRRIADPGAGLRLTAKAGRWSLGAIGINDRTPEEFAGAPSVPVAGIGVLRVQREIGHESGVGVFASDRELSSARNAVAAADIRLKLSKTWIFAGQAITTHLRDAAGTAVSGSGSFAELRRDGRNLDYSVQYLDLSSAFEAQLGFVPRVGIRQLQQQLELVRRPHGPVVKIGPTFTTAFTWDRDGTLLDRSLQASWEVKLVGETKLKVEHENAFELFQNVPFDLHATTLSLNTEWLKWLAGSASYKEGTAVNHKPPNGVAPFLADAGKGELTLTVRPTPPLRLDHTFLYSRLTTPSGARVFTDRILREKLNYQFSRALSLRAIVDYSAVERDSTLSRVEPKRRWSADVLFTYLVNPGTALYLGYRDGYENLAMQPGSPPTLYRTGEPTTSVGRQVFVKLSYLFRF